MTNTTMLRNSSSDEEDDTVLSTNIYKQQNYSRVGLLLRYPLIACLIAIGLIFLSLYTFARILVTIQEAVFAYFSKHRALRLRLANSLTFEDWKRTAQVLDQVLDREKWKQEGNDDPCFDESLLIRSTRKMKRYLDTNQIVKLSEIVSVAASKEDYCGVECESLYSKCFTGTKNTVDDYVETLIKALHFLAATTDMPKEDKIRLFHQISTNYGRSCLCLSGGATLVYFHLGVLKVLHEQKFMPNVITGSSAGSLIAAAVACRTNEELDSFFEPTISAHINCLAADWATRWDRLLRTGGMFDDEDFRNEAAFWTQGDTTFLEAFEKTGRILNIAVTSNESHSKTKVLNYINTPNVTIKSAVVASSSIPLFLPPCPLFCKRKNGDIVTYLGNGKLWRDGSLKADIPFYEVQRMSVKYTIVSQVNPHASAFHFYPKGQAGKPPEHRSGRGWRGGFLLASSVKVFVLSLHMLLNFVRDMEILPKLNGVTVDHIWLQTFEGSITIMPTLKLDNFVHFFQDPDFKRTEQFIIDGERATWPAMKAISNRVRIEQAILEISLELRNESQI